MERLSKYLVLYVLTVTSGCKVGWEQYKDHCYFIGLDQLTWYEASYLCKAHHSSLAVIETIEENTFLKNEVKPRLGSYWVGGTDDVVEGDWRWLSSDGDIPMNFTDWGLGQPDNLHHTEDCLLLNQAYQWHWSDASCLIREHYICERGITTEELEVIG